jgi:hypothetical protein
VSAEAARAAHLTVAVTRRGAVPEPRLTPAFAPGADFRACRAAVYRLAAAVELATPGRERWIVQSTAWHVALELFLGDEAEVARAVAVLEAVARAERPEMASFRGIGATAGPRVEAIGAQK